jgi:flagellar biosynthesis component FlhA
MHYVAMSGAAQNVVGYAVAAVLIVGISLFGWYMLRRGPGERR